MVKKLPKKIRASRELQGKVGIGVIDEKKIGAAQRLMDNNKVDFGPLARPDLDRLQKAIDAAREGMSDSAAAMQSLKIPIMNLKANAGSFNYGFVSQLTGMVLLFLEDIDKPDKKIIQIVDILHKTILLALAYQMSGDGGNNGQMLLKTFEEVCRKYKRPA